MELYINIQYNKNQNVMYHNRFVPTISNLPSPVPLRRTYKALCLCGRITHVYNKNREGGICITCEKRISKL